MSLKTQKILFLDCQTTGMHPSTGHLLELAWAETSAADEKILRAGYELFCPRHRLDSHSAPVLRQLVTLGLKLLRAEKKEKTTAEEVEEPEELSPEGAADKYERMAQRAAAGYRRSKVLTELLNVRITWGSGQGLRTLEIRDGKLYHPEAPAACSLGKWPWAQLDIADYDRMSVQLAELQKHTCSLEH